MKAQKQAASKVQDSTTVDSSANDEDTETKRPRRTKEEVNNTSIASVFNIVIETCS